MTRLPFLLVLASVALPTGLAPVAAASVAVSTAGFDLGTHAGRTGLDRRLVTAADKVCGGPTRTEMEAWMRCRTEALGQARADMAAAMNRPHLVAAR